MSKDFPRIIILILVAAFFAYYAHFIFARSKKILAVYQLPVPRETPSIILAKKTEGASIILYVFADPKSDLTPKRIQLIDKKQQELKLILENNCQNLAPPTWNHYITNTSQDQLTEEINIIYENPLGVEFFTPQKIQGACE